MLRADMEGVLAIIFIFGGGTLFLLAISPVGKAIADRIRHGTQPRDIGPDPAVLNELDQLRGEVTDLQERMDFAERMLSEQKAPGQVGRGGPS
jgi:hypothetical protein